MSCGLALSIALMMTDPNVATAAAVPPPPADAPVSVAGGLTVAAHGVLWLRVGMR